MKKGTTRRVYIFGKFVIKIALIKWSDALKELKNNIKHEISLILKYKSDYFNFKRKNRFFIKKGDEEFVLKRSQQLQMEVLPIKWYEFHLSVAFFLFAGVMANRQERFLYKQTKNVFLMPTYTSLFFGLVNIQKRGKEITFWGDDNDELYHFLFKNCKNSSQVFCDGHVVREIKNFVLDDDNHIKIVDYGHRQLEPFIKLNGERFYNNFKLPE